MSDPRSLIAEAEKLAKPQTGFFSFFGGSSSYRLEEATDLYIQAANAFRLKKDFGSAGSQFLKAADLQSQLNNHNDTANHLIEAYKCFKSVSPADAIDALSRAIHIFLTQNGQFRRAANFQMDLAELYEQTGDVENATSSYEKAGDYFSTDHAEALSNKAFLKCADLNAGSGNYRKARDLYDNIIKNSVGNNLTKWNLKEYFLKNILCTLCMDDVVDAQKRLDAFAEEEPSWPTTREYKLVSDILAAIDSGDVQAFSDTVYEFDQFSKLDKLKTQLLLKIKNSVVENDDDDLT
ncbi:putative alpha-soluble NSF attachment protein [Clavispora lusitaniae]|uniref:Alpha-soluble NSF attachment protein n=1 Tax=Clavispora lusitaniae TaxID=36911 RepID=A0AA91T1R2_CLALS|nr:vesicular-fusion protein S17 [Clavispora lusitaniae]OVF08524.1 putative alpha-soluble NSF attachment protein [Clavispora lusitaniae]